MREELGLRPIDDADRAFLTRLAQGLDQLAAADGIAGAPPIRQRAHDAALAKGELPAVRARRGNSLDLHRAVPIIGGRDGATVGAEADQHRLITISRTAELADVELALPAHRGRRGVADMRVVRPDDGLRLRTARTHQYLQRIEHMAVAQIPAFHRTAVHQPVITLGGPDDAGILRHVEERLAVLADVIEPVGEEVVQLLDHLVFARILLAVIDRPAIGSGLVLPWGQTGVALPCRGSRRQIDLVEIAQDRRDRGAEAVDVEAAKRGAAL